jgi:NitT/TauT family transport system substrate-binding protein
VETTKMKIARRTVLLIAALSLNAALAFPAASQTLTPIRFTLDFKFQGIHAWYYVAREKGYFRAEGLDVTIDQGEGSAATITRIMTGAYDAGFGDINAIIQQAAQKPGEQPTMVYQIYSRPPFVLVTKADGPIKTVKDVEGQTLGGPAGSATLRLFPSFAKRNGIDASKVQMLNMAPNLQEQMLIQGQVAGSLVFNVTSYMNLVQQRLDPDKDFRWFNYGDYGLDLYSNGLMVSPKAEGKSEGGRGPGESDQSVDQGGDRQPRRRHRYAAEDRAAAERTDREAAHRLRPQEPHDVG